MLDNNTNILLLLSKAEEKLTQQRHMSVASSAHLAAAINKLILQYGADAVQAAAASSGVKKTGRKAEADWPLLNEVLKQDAREWLDGKAPFTTRSNYAVAMSFAKVHPGYNAVATQWRVMGKLSRKRKLYLPYMAWEISENERAYTDHWIDCERICEISTDRFREIIASNIVRQQENVKRYRRIFGDPPATTSMAEIERKVEQAETEWENRQDIAMPVFR